MRLNNCPMDILIIPCGMRIRSTHLLISLGVLNHAVHKTIDFQIDLNILRTTGPIANLTLPVDCACSSMYYRYKRTKTAQKINPVTLKITKLQAKNPPKHQYLLYHFKMHTSKTPSAMPKVQYHQTKFFEFFHKVCILNILG